MQTRKSNRMNPVSRVIFGIGLLFLVFFDVSVSDTKSQEITEYSGYSEVCNKTVKCRSDSWLRCNEITGTCGCLYDQEMTYETSKKTCVVLLGKSCELLVPQSVIARTKTTTTTSTTYRLKKAGCVIGAECGFSGLCSCPTGTYENLTQLNQTVCSPVKDYGSRCSHNVECDGAKMFTCVEGYCGCDPKTTIYNSTARYVMDWSYYYGNKVKVSRGVCVGRVGSACSYTGYRLCVPNALCDRDSNVCECHSSFTTTSKLLCGATHGHVCTNGRNSSINVGSETLCSEKLVCSGDVDTSYKNGYSITKTRSKCQCPNPDFQEFDVNLEICRSRVGFPCIPSEKNGCTGGAVCKKAGKTGQFQCKCDVGYVMTKTGKCQRAYGQPCEYGDEEKAVDSAVACDNVANLKCVNGVCSCANGIDEYEEERRRCSIAIGVPCWSSLKCVKNAICVRDNSLGKGFPGRCVDKLEFDGNRTMNGTESEIFESRENIEMSTVLTGLKI